MAKNKLRRTENRLFWFAGKFDRGLRTSLVMGFFKELGAFLVILLAVFIVFHVGYYTVKLYVLGQESTLEEGRRRAYEQHCSPCKYSQKQIDKFLQEHKKMRRHFERF